MNCSTHALQKICFTALAALLFIIIASTTVYAQSESACIAQGDSRTQAVSAYAAQCSVPRVDCDPIGSVWYCSSETISQATLPGIIPTPVTPTTPATTSTTLINSLYNICTTPDSDPDGDGYGWENNASCVVNGTNAAQVTNIPPTAAARPAASVQGATGHPGLGQSNGRPICLSDSNAENGYSFENNQSCIVVAGVTATRSNPLIQQRVCTPWMEISYGNHYVLQNNTWNSDGVYQANWTQCIHLGGSTGNYIASWDYNWLARTEGDEYSVKSYPQVYYGRKTRYNQSGSPTETGLPANINNLPQISVDFKFSETGNAERNVALESFLHTSCEAEDNNKFFEMMVWVGRPTIRTPGTPVATATIDGINWDVYTNPQLTWGYVAFVAQQPFNEGTLDWNAFIDWSRTQGPAYGVPPTGNNTCLGAIEIGTETFWGNGTFTLDRFNVQVR